MADETTMWKVLAGPDGLTPCHGGQGDYPGPGEWSDTIADVEECERGYHVAQGPQLLRWLPHLDSFAVWEVTPGAVLVDAGDKWVTDRVRLDRRWDVDARMLRLFAADCAEAALLGERASGREPESRSWVAVSAARRFAGGEIDREEMEAASAAAREAALEGALAAAGAAAWEAAWEAAWAAALAATWETAGAAAWETASAAATAAAWAAAWETARAAAWETAKSNLYRLFVARLTGETPSVCALYEGADRG